MGLRILAILVASCWHGQETEARDASLGTHRHVWFTGVKWMRRKWSKVATSGVLPGNHRCKRDRRERIDSLYDRCEIERENVTGRAKIKAVPTWWLVGGGGLTRDRKRRPEEARQE